MLNWRWAFTVKYLRDIFSNFLNAVTISGGDVFKIILDSHLVHKRLMLVFIFIGDVSALYKCHFQTYNRRNLN